MTTITREDLTPRYESLTVPEHFSFRVEKGAALPRPHENESGNHRGC